MWGDMIRLRIVLKSKKGKLRIPFNYNHILSAIIYKNIADLDLAYDLHSSSSFKFFTFSQINISKRQMIKEGFISLNGSISFLISSPNDYLVKSIVEGALDNLEIDFSGQKLFIEKIELLKEHEFKKKMNFTTLSPVTARVKKEIDGELKIRDLAPGEEFFNKLEKNLIKKFCEFNHLEETDKKIKIYSEMRNVKRKRIKIPKGPQTTFHRAYMMDFVLDGDEDLIKFAYECGLGEKNSMGFGMLKVVQ